MPRVLQVQVFNMRSGRRNYVYLCMHPRHHHQHTVSDLLFYSKELMRAFAFDAACMHIMHHISTRVQTIPVVILNTDILSSCKHSRSSCCSRAEEKRRENREGFVCVCQGNMSGLNAFPKEGEKDAHQNKKNKEKLYAMTEKRMQKRWKMCITINHVILHWKIQTHFTHCIFGVIKAPLRRSEMFSSWFLAVLILL